MHRVLSLIGLLFAAVLVLSTAACAYEIPSIVECPNVVYTSSAPNSATLQEWTIDDYDEVNGFHLQGGTVADRGYLFNSTLTLPAAEGNVFRPDYKHTNMRTSFPRDGSSPGVPGPYPYDEGFEKWGGDEVTVGRYRYSDIIGHFGHTHILTVHSKISALRRSACTSTSSQDLMLDHLLEGSTQIFAWFAGLVDSNGNPTPASTHPFLIQLQGMMKTLIFGDNTGPNGEIDLNALFTTLQGFIDYAAAANHPNLPLLQAEAGRVQAFLTDTLRLAGSNPIPLVAWYPLMADHQKGVVDTFLRYREVYRTIDSIAGYADIEARANEQHIHGLRHGPQMAAFFGVFYSFTNFLDKMYYTPVDDEYAIPTSIMNTNIDYVHHINKWYWTEHVVMFGDYNKAAALDDETPGVDDQMFRIQINMLDSCTHIAGTVGEIFYRFDRLVRGRNVYAFIGGLS